MPIRINLLAEDQAAEELRRKDPVKRAYLGAGLVVAAVLVWSSTLQFKIVAARGGLNDLQAKWNAIEKSYQTTVGSQRNAIEAEQKLTALQQLTTNRFLWGQALNAMQKTVSPQEDIQLVRFKAEQGYFFMEETKPRTNNTGVISGRPASATEKVTLIIDAIDFSPQPGGGVNKFKEAIARVPYFQAHLEKTNGVRLTSLSAPQAGPNARQTFVTFTLQCGFPEKVRH
jgi:hypothetical protein